MAEKIGQDVILKPTKRGTEKVRMVRKEIINGKEEIIDCMMPIGRGWNAGNGVEDYKKMGCGWMTWEEYEDKKRSDKMAAEMEAIKKENEELKAKKGK